MKVVEMDIFDLMYEPFKFDTTKPIKLFEAFSGIGTQYMALKRLQKEKEFELEVVGISEIDKFAIASYESIHGKVKNYGGVGSFERFPKDIDIATWSFPCQDISLAGKQSGMEDGSRSNYGYVFLDTVKNTPKNERPKVLVMENVRALFSEKFKDDWREIQLRLEEMGYKNYSDILIATDYGIPQTRERVFIISILGEYNYNFPKPIKLEKRLKDFLEDEVDEKYYLSDKMIDYLTGVNQKESKYDRAAVFERNIYEDPNIAATITTRSGSRPTDNYIIEEDIEVVRELYKKHGGKIFKEAYEGDGVYINRPHQKRGVVQKDKIQTIKTSIDDLGVVVKKNKTHTINGKVDGKQPSLQDRIYKSEGSATAITTSYHPNYITKLGIRKLTPREAWRLMGIDDEDFEKAEKVVSSTQLYKQAGNAIVVDVLYHIFKQMF